MGVCPAKALETVPEAAGLLERRFLQLYPGREMQDTWIGIDLTSTKRRLPIAYPVALCPLRWFARRVAWSAAALETRRFRIWAPALGCKPSTDLSNSFRRAGSLPLRAAMAWGGE
jgi:hypothetical protein